MREEILRVSNLKKYYPVSGGFFSREKFCVKAVDDLSFSLSAGETLGIVGESGCGKTTAGKTILRLIEPTDGEIIFGGHNVTKATRSELKEIRRGMQFIFQDPQASLNPRMKVGDIIGEALTIHNIASGEKKKAIVDGLLERVGLPVAYAGRHPHEFSGGQRQRIGIARALALSPRLVVCDEPVSALDVSIQSQILNLLKHLQRDLGLTYIFISHGLAAVKHISDRIAVMYLGRIVETANAEDIFAKPLHPYTEALLSANPVPDPKAKKNRIILEGDMPNPIHPPDGCHFHTRCPYARDLCRSQAPEWRERAPNRFLSCHYPLA